MLESRSASFEMTRFSDTRLGITWVEATSYKYMEIGQQAGKGDTGLALDK